MGGPGGRGADIPPSRPSNWPTQVLLYVLLGVTSGAVAEKLLLSFYVLLLAGAAWFFAGSVEPERRIPAFLALPFAYNYTVH